MALLVESATLLISRPLTIFSMFFKSLAGDEVDVVLGGTDDGGGASSSDGRADGSGGGSRTGGEGSKRCALRGEGLGLTVSKADELPLPTSGEGLGVAEAVDVAAGDVAPSVYGANRCGLRRSLTVGPRDDVGVAG